MISLFSWEKYHNTRCRVLSKKNHKKNAICELDFLYQKTVSTDMIHSLKSNKLYNRRLGKLEK
ncbi:hypothetical protein H1P_1600014 [Hyella patelloides LEGE 07179]|uniref:Transposase n=1 Tax=Hyella patelloides LEGE 07179 TaxID=945734 RepID=A0A563VMQ8_9CYAN|nr:hypothetical protein H1P_1600014 [Hyella patelloides LEGE 07179]